MTFGPVRTWGAAEKPQNRIHESRSRDFDLSRTRSASGCIRAAVMLGCPNIRTVPKDGLNARQA